MLLRWQAVWPRKALVALLLLYSTLLPTVALAQDTMEPPDEDVEAIAQVIDDALAAFMAGDGESLDALTADNFIWINSAGEMIDREGWLESGSMGLFTEMSVSNVTMTALSEDMVHVIMHLDAEGDGEFGPNAIFETESALFQRADDDWQLTFLQATDRRAETDAYWAEAMREEMFAALPTLTIDVTDEGIDLPEEVPAGPTLIELTNSAGTTNDDGSPLMADVGRLAEGATADDLLPLLASAEEDPGPALELVKLYGTQIVPGGRMVWDLQPGEHVAMTTSGEPMAQPFTVVEGEGEEAEMMADVEVEVVDFAFVMPDEISSGPHVWQITNAGSQWHEVIVLQLQEGMAVEDLLNMFAGEGGPPPADGATEEGAAADDTDAMTDTAEASDSEPMTDTAAAGGEEAPAADEASGPPEGEMPFDLLYGYVVISEGNTVWVEVDLPPGEYTVICFLPDLLGDMSPHAAHGMVRTLVVTE